MLVIKRDNKGGNSLWRSRKRPGADQEILPLAYGAGTIVNPTGAPGG